MRWNRWHPGDIPSPRDGRLVYKPQLRSHLGIVLKVYKSTSKAKCWTANVKFLDPKLNSDYWGLEGHPIPLNCLIRLS